jgi:hypothetical protein
LAAAAANVADRQAQEEAAREVRHTAQEKRFALAADADTILAEIMTQLQDHIRSGTPDARIAVSGDTLHVALGSAELEVDLQGPGILKEGAFPRSKWDVVRGAAIQVSQRSPSAKRAANLWYTNRGASRALYRWYEVGYEGNPLTRQGFENEPAAVSPEMADHAHSPAMDVVQVSYPPTPIDDDSVPDFCDRWAFLLAEACDGRLSHVPRGLPRP